VLSKTALGEDGRGGRGWLAGTSGMFLHFGPLVVCTSAVPVKLCVNPHVASPTVSRMRDRVCEEPNASQGITYYHTALPFISRRSASKA
ncbi:hypothetical protein K0M31_002039, partial [Melipona bicolor]